MSNQETILYEDSQHRFMFFPTEEVGREGQYTFYIKDKNNPLNSGWAYFDTRQEANVYGYELVLKYRSEVTYE